MRIGKSKPAGEYENMVAAIFDLYAIDYNCQVWFHNHEDIDELDVINFRADFVLVGFDVVIEIDDPTHDTWKKRKADRVKDAIYHARGFSVLRVKTRELDRDPQQVAGHILSIVDGISEQRGY